MDILTKRALFSLVKRATKRAMYGTLLPLMFHSCAMTPEQQATMEQVSADMYRVQRDMNNLSPYQRGAGGPCSPTSIAPIGAHMNCSFACINGTWAEVCRGAFE